MEVKLSLREEADNVKCAWRQPTNYTDYSSFPSWTSGACFAPWGAKYTKDNARSLCDKDNLP